MNHAANHVEHRLARVQLAMAQLNQRGHQQQESEAIAEEGDLEGMQVVTDQADRDVHADEAGRRRRHP